MNAKKALNLLLVTVLVLSATLSMPFSAASEVTPKSGVTGDLSWSLDASGVLTISGNGAMPSYSMTSAPWYDFFGSIKSVVIEKGVTSIGNYAFSVDGRYTVISVNDPENAGVWTFTKRCNITTVSIPGSVKSFGEYVFWGCKKITIECPTQSAAAGYADDNNITSDLLLFGDTDCNGEITTYDAVLSLQNVAEIASLGERQSKLADVDGVDGVTTFDCVLTLQYMAEIISIFPVTQ